MSLIGARRVLDATRGGLSRVTRALTKRPDARRLSRPRRWDARLFAESAIRCGYAVESERGRHERRGRRSRPGRTHLIERPRLTCLLDAAEARIILLVAPAGYGKTTL